MFKKAISYLDKKVNPEKYKNDVPMQLGYSGRESVIDPYYRDYMSYPVIYPDGENRFAIERINLKDIHELKIKKAIDVLANTPEMAFAINTVVDSTIKGWNLVGSSRQREIVMEMYDNMTMSGQSPLALFKRLVYGIYVEGAACAELVFSASEMDKKPIKISYCSPYSLSFVKKTDDNIGEYYLVVQYQDTHDYKILFDEANPKAYETFRYIPINVRGTNPYGSSQVAAALFPTTAKMDFMQRMVEWLQGQVQPMRLFQLDVESLAKAGYAPQDIKKAAEVFESLMKGALNMRDLTQDPTISVPVKAIVIGALENSQISGLDVILDMFDRAQQRAFNLHRVVFGGRRQGGGLNDRESEYGYFQVYEMCENFRNMVTELVNPFHEIILNFYGVPNDPEDPVLLELDSDDIWIERLHAEAFDIKMQGYERLEALGVLTKEELRQKVISNTFDLTDLPPELPEELAKMQQMAMEQMQMMNNPDNEPEGDNE